MAFDNKGYFDDCVDRIEGKFFDSEGQNIIGNILLSIAYSLASIADALDDFNEKDDDDRMKGIDK